MRTNKRQANKIQRVKSRPRPQSLKTFVDYELDGPSRSKKRSGISVFFAHHLHIALQSFQQLVASPFSSFLTAAVIAIALALPAGLYLLLHDLEKVVGNWQGSAQISVFLKSSVHEGTGRKIAGSIKSWPESETVEFISSEQAMQEFQQHSGFGDALALLDDNPLPSVIVVQPVDALLNQEDISALVKKLKQLADVDMVQVDFEWIQRLNHIIGLAQRGTLILFVLLSLAVLIIIGNTIRLTIFNRRQEILVTKLIGGTNTFIRRPFLYTGLWYGMFGSILAGLLVSIIFWLISGPVALLAAEYNSTFRVTGLGMFEATIVLGAGVALGLVGSWIAVTRHIRAIEPT